MRTYLILGRCVLVALVLTVSIWLFAFWLVSLVLEKILGGLGINVRLAKGVGSFIKLIVEAFIKIISFLFQWLVLEPMRFLVRLVSGGRNRDRFYSNPFLNFWEMGMMFSKRNKGFNLDSRYKLTETDSLRNLWIQGATGSGKGVNVLIPSIITSDNSMVVINTGSVKEKTIGYLQSRNYWVRELNFKDKNLSWRTNPLKDVKTSYAKAKKIANQLIRSSMGEGKDDPFWQMSAQMMLGCVIALVCQQTESRFHNIPNVLKIINQIARGKHPATLLETADETIYDEYMSAVSNEKTLPSIISTIKASLEVFSDPEIALLCSEDTIGFEDLRDPNQKLIIYITCPESEVKYYSPFLNLFFLNLWDFLMNSGHESAPMVAIHLDELPSLGKMNNILETLSQNRKKNFGHCLYSQSMTALISVHGKDIAHAIINGCTNGRLFLPGQEDPETLNYLERVLGRMRQVYRDFKGDRHEEIRSVLSVPEIRSYPYAIFLKAGTKAMKFKPKPFYKDHTLLKRSRIPMQLLNVPLQRQEVEYFDQTDN